MAWWKESTCLYIHLPQLIPKGLAIEGSIRHEVNDLAITVLAESQS